MPAPKKRFYSARDIQTMLGISRSKANQIMHHCLKKARPQSSKGGTNDAADSSCKAFQ